MGEETGAKWWVRYVVVPLIAGGGTLTLILALMHPSGRDKDTPKEPIGVMGQLEVGINRQGMDISAVEMHTANAEICAELCRRNGDCKAMTYVISLKTCWLKLGVPPPFPPGGPDYVSSVKQ